MKKRTLISLLILSSSALLPSCSNKNVATITDITKDSHYGKITIVDPKESYSAGDVVTFSVKAIEDFSVDYLVMNGEKVAYDENKVYNYTLKAGENKIGAYYTVNKDVDFVDKFKLNVTQDVFDLAMGESTYKYIDFRKNGFEEMMTTYTDPSDAFTNYVDGDTTHISTRNFGYTVKIRYLGIDTPESTSELEEWGKSAALYNKKVLSEAKHIVLESQGWARGDDNKAATADNNQRSLAYVWYSNVEEPTMNDFRCLNLEMVYQGFSQGIGSLDDMGEKFYWAFDAANKSAIANKRHQYSGEPDPNYYYYSADNPPVEKSLKEIYSSVSIGDGTLTTPLFDLDDTHSVCSKTLYKVSGYVTRKISGAFYFQDKASYDMPTDGTLPEAYGMYVFTYAQTPIKVGDYVSVIGVLSQYSGTLQMMGISYHEFDADPYRDTMIDATKSVSADQIKPIALTKDLYAKYGNSIGKNLNHVLVSFEDDIYCYKDATFTDGGVQEVDRYNTHYPFYCTSNKLIFFGHIGSASDSSAVRIVQDQDVLVSYGTENSYTYKFYTGGTNNYNPAGAEYVYPTVITTTSAQTDEEKAAAERLITTTYDAKKISLTGIWGNYISSSGSTTRDQLNIVNADDVTILGTY